VKKSTIALIACGVIVVIVGSSSISTYNTLVASKENVSSSLSAIDAQYQRRSDLIPQLVATVEQAVTSERKTLDAVIEARASATGINLGSDPSAEDIEAYTQAQANVGSSLGRLIAITESYPDLKSTAGFSDLQAQLEGTENRITVARTDYNDEARKYNTTISKFPTVLIASMFGHTDKVEYFQAEVGAEQAPELNFTDTAE
jgi:LemA protein